MEVCSKQWCQETKLLVTENSARFASLLTAILKRVGYLSFNITLVQHLSFQKLILLPSLTLKIICLLKLSHPL